MNNIDILKLWLANNGINHRRTADKKIAVFRPYPSNAQCIFTINGEISPLWISISEGGGSSFSTEDECCKEMRKLLIPHYPHLKYPLYSQKEDTKDLDRMVRDHFAIQADHVNNCGREHQIRFLQEAGILKPKLTKPSELKENMSSLEAVEFAGLTFKVKRVSDRIWMSINSGRGFSNLPIFFGEPGAISVEQADILWEHIKLQAEVIKTMDNTYSEPAS